MKKIYICLLTILISSSPLFAYEINVTRLTDKSYYPLYDSDDPNSSDRLLLIFYKGPIERSESDYSDKQIATISLKFRINEIGNDYDAVIILARKECAKLGANQVFNVSGTQYKDLGEIASETFRCVRTELADEIEKLFKPGNETRKMRKDLESSAFLRRLEAVLTDGSGSLSKIKEIGEEEYLKREVGIKVQTKKTKDDLPKVVYFDVKTGKELNDKEVSKRIEDYMSNFLSDAFISFYKDIDNYALYRFEYDRIAEVKRKYPDSTLNLFLPELDAKGEINYKKLKKDLIKGLVHNLLN